jgi:hypothetical protein
MRLALTDTTPYGGLLHHVERVENALVSSNGSVRR